MLSYYDIDDDIAVRTSLLLLFRKEGYQATEAASEEEALGILSKQVVSLVYWILIFPLKPQVLKACKYSPASGKCWPGSAYRCRCSYHGRKRHR